MTSENAMLKCTACNKEFKDKRGLNTHAQFHCKSGQQNPNVKPVKKRVEKNQEQNKAKCTCPDGGSWAMLKRSNKVHDVFMDTTNPATGEACKQYCTKCEEVY